MALGMAKPYTKVLAQPDLEKIHETSLRALEKVGVKFQDEAALKIFRGAGGATVDGESVYLSRQLVEWAIDQAPGKFILRARNPAYDVALGQSQVLYTSAFGATFVCDAEAKTYRPATLDDLAEYVLLADKLENVHYVLTPFIP